MGDALLAPPRERYFAEDDPMRLVSVYIAEFLLDFDADQVLEKGWAVRQAGTSTLLRPVTERLSLKQCLAGPDTLIVRERRGVPSRLLPRSQQILARATRDGPRRRALCSQARSRPFLSLSLSIHSLRRTGPNWAIIRGKTESLNWVYEGRVLERDETGVKRVVATEWQVEGLPGGVRMVRFEGPGHVRSRR